MNERTVRLYENRGDIDVPMIGCGKNPIPHESVEPALSYAMLSYIQLEILE